MLWKYTNISVTQPYCFMYAHSQYGSSIPWYINELLLTHTEYHSALSLINIIKVDMISIIKKKKMQVDFSRFNETAKLVCFS